MHDFSLLKKQRTLLTCPIISLAYVQLFHRSLLMPQVQFSNEKATIHLLEDLFFLLVYHVVIMMDHFGKMSPLSWYLRRLLQLLRLIVAHSHTHVISSELTRPTADRRPPTTDLQRPKLLYHRYSLDIFTLVGELLTKQYTARSHFQLKATFYCLSLSLSLYVYIYIYIYIYIATHNFGRFSYVRLHTQRRGIAYLIIASRRSLKIQATISRYIQRHTSHAVSTSAAEMSKCRHSTEGV